MSDDCTKVAKGILGKLNRDVVPEVKKNGQCALDFQKKILDGMSSSGGSEMGSYSISFIHYGSAYEGLAIDEKADFDIAVVLGKPFESENFMITRDPTGYFTLEWKSHLPYKPMSDGDGYVDAAKIRSTLFDNLMRTVSEVQIPNAEIKFWKGCAAVTAEIKYNPKRKVMVDLVPQIVFRTWGQCPDLKPLQELPKTLRCYIDTLNKNKSPIMFMTLYAYVDKNQNCPNPDQLFDVSFALLEKKFLTSNVELRDMVRLVKLVAKKREWKERPQWWFHSFCAKRLAVRYCDELKGKTVWEGYKAILGYLSKAVERGYLDGYFINGQIAYKWNPEQQVKFRRDIAIALEMHPSELDLST